MIIFLIIVLLGCALSLAYAPQFGSAGKNNRIMQSVNFKDSKFHNTHSVGVSSSGRGIFKATLDYFTGQQQREPEAALPSQQLSVDQLGKSQELRITWLGHSTNLIEIDSQIILTDPVFGERVSPFSFMGPKRFASELPIQPQNLPQLDAVIISHDHYDHLDYRTILELKDKTKKFYVPLGVGGHLKHWGISEEKIIELDWWESHNTGSLNIVATPSQHFSGRGLIRNKTLWASWVIEGKTEKVFFGGDSGYFDGFKTIGNKYGPFDITLLESGAYNKAWADIHMIPEQTVQAHIDLQGKLLLPIHWAKFNLSLHAWTEPIERLLVAAEKAGVQVTTPLQGEQIVLQSPPLRHWWAEAGERRGNPSLTAKIYE